MVKKYPFSTKAAKAMIAATIAFTPVATTAGLFSASKVEAAETGDQKSWHFSSVANLALYSELIHDKALVLDSEDAVEDVKEALDAMSDDDWIAVVTPLLEDTANEMEVLAAAKLFELNMNLYLNGLSEDEINTFINQTDDNFGYATSTEYLAYLKNVEKSVHGAYKTETTDGVNDPAVVLFESLVTALKNAEDNSADEKFKSKLENTFKVWNSDDVQEAGLELLIRLGVGTDTLKAAGQAGVDAWDSLYDQNKPGGSTGPIGPIDPGPVDPEPTPDDGEVTIPATPGAEVEVTPAIVTENNGNVTATIPQALQAQIVSAVTVQTPRVAITLPQVTPGGAATIAIPGGLVQGILGVTQSASLVVVGPSGASINLPLGQLAGGFGSGFGSGTLNLTMKPATASERTGLLSQITNRLNGFGSGTGSASSETKAAALVGNVKMPAPATNVSISATISGQTVPVTTFGDIYIEREFPLTGAVDTNRTTGATIAADGTVKAIPTTFKTVEGTQFAVLKTLYNSADTYTVLETNQTFPDIDGGKNWAEKYIESLSSKFIISGTTAGTYKPDQDMTRSQFAFLLSRALGLPGTTAYDGRFSDVEGDEWFNANGEFMAAVQYGVIAGKTDGTFGADEKVTRAEAAAMIGRAMELGFIEFDKSQLDTSKTLAGFKDAKEIGASTRAEVLKVVQAGIMSGASNGEFNPNDYTKRDQMARILAEFLMKAELMQDIK